MQIATDCARRSGITYKGTMRKAGSSWNYFNCSDEYSMYASTLRINTKVELFVCRQS